MSPLCKSCLILFMWALAASTCNANEIDSLKTQNDVMAFFARHFSKDFESSDFKFLFRSNERLADSSWIFRKDTSDVQRYHRTQFLTMYRSNSFYKTDIDKNGKTDLILDANVLVVIMDINDSMQWHTIDWQGSMYFYENMLTLPDGSNALRLKHVPPLWRGDSVEAVIDTVIYRSNQFVEYNSHYYKTADISKIGYHFHSASDVMPYSLRFCMEINSSGNCLFDGRIAKSDKFERNGKYMLFNKAVVKSIFDIASYADLRSKKDIYKIRVNHSSGCDITIYYKDGYQKTIHTWGMRGTLGLSSTEALIFDLACRPDWQQANTAIDCVEY